MPDTIKKKESIIRYINELKDKLADLKTQLDEMEIIDTSDSFQTPDSTEDQFTELSINLKGNETILVVDDEALLRDSICRNLERYGYTIIAAKDAGDALNLIEHRAEPIDLLLTDIVMPGMGVQEMVQVIRSRFPEIKVIFMSGYSDGDIIPNEVFDVLHSKAELIKKPFFSTQLTSKIRQILDNG